MRLAGGGRNAELIGERQVEREILGALIVEQIETDLPREILEPRIDLVYEHSARALSNALDYHSVFLMPVWQPIGKSTVLVKGRNLPKTLTIGGLILAALLALFLIRTDFDLKADGTLQPVNAARRLLRQQRHDQGSAGARAIRWSSRAMHLLRLENHELEQKWQRDPRPDQRDDRTARQLAASRRRTAAT